MGSFGRYMRDRFHHMVRHVNLKKMRRNHAPNGETGRTTRSNGSGGARRTLTRGVLVFRWVALAWMSTIAVIEAGADEFQREPLAWVSIGLAAAWTAWLTLSARRWDRIALWLDLAVCTWLVLASGLVVFEGEIVAGRAFFATGYPLTAALSWGVHDGPRGGLFAGGVLGLALAVARPLNGVAIGDLPAREVRSLVGGIINYLVAGGAVGFVSKLFVQSSEALSEATAALVRERERAARLAERESIARQIHDSVLQALALITKKGRQLSQTNPIPPDEVAELGRLAEKQEHEIRSLILRDPEVPPSGRASLRTQLEAAARGVDGVEVSVSCVGPIWVERNTANELAAAVRQALANVVQHAGASRAAVFAEEEAGRVVVSVRDNGVGFVYDEAVLKADGKAGILKSMKGRVEDLGGGMAITSDVDRGTEVEFTVPLPSRRQA
jgi:signal transduction histidine kinase